jgi:hypothetical protein
MSYNGNSSGWVLAYASIISIFLNILFMPSSLSGVISSIFLRFPAHSSCHAKYSFSDVINSSLMLRLCSTAIFSRRSHNFFGSRYETLINSSFFFPTFMYIVSALCKQDAIFFLKYFQKTLDKIVLCWYYTCIMQLWH